MVSETRASQPSERNVLEDLDSRIPTTFYWYLAVLACVGGFLFGYDTSNIGSALAFIPYHLSSFWTGYLVAGASLGAGAGALIAGPLTDHFGRKTLLMTDAAIYAVGALLSAFTVNAFMLLSARTLIGLAIGADSAIATSYIAEFAPRARRGQLSIIQQWMITVGILVSYLVAVVILLALPNSAGVAEQLKNTEAARQRKTQWTRGVIRALIVVCVFFIFQQITGINIPFYYGPKILSTFFQSSHNAVAAAVAGVEVTAILGAVNVVATYFAFRWIDKFGRRPLAMGGYLGMAVFMLVAAAAVAFLTDIPKTVVVMVGFSFFITSFAIGVGGTGWLLQGEVFPTSVRGRAAAIAAAVDWVANFALIEAFPAWQNAWGLGWVMVSFAVLSLVAIGFVFRFVPETKGHSVEEVVQIFEEQAKASKAPV